MVSDDLSDQQYLLERARLVKHKDPDESKVQNITKYCMAFDIRFLVP